MCKFWVAFLISLSLYQCVPSTSTLERVCENVSSGSKTLRISVSSKKNQNNEWVDKFTAWAECSNSSDRMDVDLKHTVYECGDKRIFHIEGVTNSPALDSTERFLFHKRTGKNVVVLDNGRSAQKINNDEPFSSNLFSNRPLRNNEIFKVKLEKKNTKFNRGLGIGIMTRSPNDVDVLREMFQSSVAWMYHHGNIYHSAVEIIRDYGKNLNQVQVGDTVGVMRTENGVLHFFVNGVDQGPAASNIPSPAYAIVELWNDAMKVSIVD